MSRSRLLVAAFCLLAVLGACSSGDGSADDAGEGAGTRGLDGADPEDEAGSARVPVAALALSAMVGDVERYWTEAAPEAGLDAYTPLAAERIVAVSDLDDGLDVRCDGEPILSQDAADNAFVAPCEEGITVVFDDVGLFPQLARRFGDVGAVTTVAHEWGHVIQAQLAGGADELASLVAEQQADCFAGSYTAWARDRDLAPFDTPAGLDLAVGATIESRDEVGSAPDDEEAHGSGFDRVRAFQEGFDRGAAYCATFPDLPLPITQMEFGSGEDEDSGGNLELDEAIEALGQDAADYFAALAPSVGAPEVDEGGLEDVYDRFGDNAVGLELGLAWAGEAQAAAGETTEGDGPLLQRACLVGAWLGEDLEAGDEADLALSAGDLDEAILALSQHGAVRSTPGLVFEAVASLRLGVTEGLVACRFPA